MNIISAEKRHVDLPGLINFRDIGFYPATDLAGQCRIVKPGVLYRAGHFHDLDEQSNKALADRHIDLVFDFRNEKERLKRPSQFFAPFSPTIIELTLDPGSGASFLKSLPDIRNPDTTLDVSTMERMMQQINRSLVTDHADVYRQFFDHLLVATPSAAVFHCASGKDRTGVAAALLLSALGVERDTIIEDYMLTNSCLDVHHHVARAMADFDNRYQSIMQPEVLTAMYEVQPSYLSSALDEIDQQYGSMQSYLQRQMGMDDSRLQQLQHRYLTE